MSLSCKQYLSQCLCVSVARVLPLFILIPAMESIVGIESTNYGCWCVPDFFNIRPDDGVRLLPVYLIHVCVRVCVLILHIQGFAESLQHQQKALRVEPSLHGRPVVQVFHIRNTQPSTLFVDVAKILQNPVLYIYQVSNARFFRLQFAIIIRLVQCIMSFAFDQPRI